MAGKKQPYDPKGLYRCKKGSIKHRGNARTYTAGDGEVFDMSHRDSKRIEYLADVLGVIEVVPATTTKTAKVN